MTDPDISDAQWGITFARAMRLSILAAGTRWRFSNVPAPLQPRLVAQFQRTLHRLDPP